MRGGCGYCVLEEIYLVRTVYNSPFIIIISNISAFLSVACNCCAKALPRSAEESRFDKNAERHAEEKIFLSSQELQQQRD